jgi:hypothetical protein
VTPIYQHQRVHFALCDQLLGNCRLAERRGRAENPILVGSQRLGCLSLCWTAVASKINVQRISCEAMIGNIDCNVMTLKKSANFLPQAARKSNVSSQILATRDNPRFAKRRKSHRLSLVELRILKCSEAKQSLQKGVRQIFLFDEGQCPNLKLGHYPMKIRFARLIETL